MKYLVALIFATSLILCGCIDLQQNPDSSISCDSLLVTPLRENLGHPFESNDVIRMVEASYGILPEKVRVTRYGEENDWEEYIEWDDRGLHFIVTIGTGKLKIVNVSSKSEKIAADQLTECLDHQPEWYRAIYGPRMERSGIDYYFELWFPSAGIISQSRGNASHPAKLPVPTSEFPIEHIDIVVPGSLDEVYGTTYTAYLPFKLPLNKGTKLKDALQPRPWTGDWTNVQFTKGW